MATKTVSVTLSYTVTLEVDAKDAGSADLLAQMAVDTLVGSVGECTLEEGPVASLECVLSSFDDISLVEV